MDAIRDAIFQVVYADQPVTVRQVFYRLVTAGVVDKTEGEYSRTVCRLLAGMRRDGLIPYHYIADSTRWMRKPRTYSSVEDVLRRTAQAYRRSLWDDQPTYVEVWLEKEALAGVLVEVTDEYDVPLMVTRGYPSLSFLAGARETILAQLDRGKNTVIYYFGDHDPSGRDIERFVTEELADPTGNDDQDLTVLQYQLGKQYHAGEITFDQMRDRILDDSPYAVRVERVAVTEEQIAELDLPTRPTKKTDTRSKNFRGGSVEVDAIPPFMLRDLAADCIEQHIDSQRLQQLRNVEAEERRTLEEMAATFAGGQAS